MKSSKRLSKRSATRAITRSTGSIFELQELELRRMLTTATVNSSHVLVITGTGNNDSITLNQLSNGKVSVSGVSTQFSPGSTTGKFNQISVNAGNGNDLVQINNNVTYTSSTISGSGGKDTLTGGKGNDSIDGDNDNDTLDGGGGGSDLLRGDAAEDLANYSYRTDNLNISLDGVNNDGKSGEKDNVQTEEVIAGSGNDTLTGSSGNDVLNGGAGADNIEGGGGDDVVTGNTGADTLEGQNGSDYLQAKNQDTDQVSGGSDPTGGDVDLASVDPQDVPVPGAGGAVKPAVTQPAQSGQPELDPTYGTDGQGYGPNLDWERINGTAIDSQGRVVFVGTKGVPGGDSGGTDMVVARFTADGQLDTEFGNNGQLDVDFTSSLAAGEGYHDDSTGEGVTIGANDEIVVVGSVIRESQFRNDSDLAVAEITSDGQLDSNFGFSGSGEFSTDLTNDNVGDSNDTAYDAAVDVDGNVYLVADRQADTESDTTYDFVNDYSTTSNPNGQWSYGYSETLNGQVNNYDTSTTDISTTYWSSSALSNSSTFAPDSFITQNDVGASAGLEPGFYGEYSQAVFTAPADGEYEVNADFSRGNANGDADVHILVNGYPPFDGSFDSTTGDVADDDFFQLNAGDTVQFAVGYGSNHNFDNDTTYLTADITQISSSSDNTVAVAKVLANGHGLDTSYGSDGFDAETFGGAPHGNSIALTNDDSPKAVIAGEVNGEFLVARFNADGNGLDGSFNNGAGYNTDDGNEDFGAFNDVAIDSDNNIYAVGTTQNGSSFARPAGTPAANDAAVITKFNSSGNVVAHSSNSFHQSAGYSGVTIDSQGRILAVGFEHEDDPEDLDYLIDRYTASLTPDTNFYNVVSDFPVDDVSGVDVASSVRTFEDGSIVVGGFTNVSESPAPSAERFITPSPTLPGGQIPDVEQYVSDDDLKNPPPALQALLNGLSPSALQLVLSEPDSDGNATITTGDGNDKIILTTIRAADGEEEVAVSVNDGANGTVGVTTYYNPSITKHLYINTNGGNDTVLADDDVNIQLIINTGSGNDSVVSDGDESVIMGGQGNDKLSLGTDSGVLVGGDGNDTLIGNNHYDILIGGKGTDSLTGGHGQDIMIGGTTSYDTDPVALRSLLDEWRAGKSRSVRDNDLKNGGGNNGSNVLRGKGVSNQTVFDDNSKDTLDGGADNDWFFRHTGTNADVLKNSSGEELTSI